MDEPSSNWPENNRDLDLGSFELVYEEYRSIFNFETPYPPFKELDEVAVGKILSAIHSVSFTSLEGLRHYSPGFETAGAYLYFLIKAHALLNGNKRVGLVGLLAYLKYNKKWLKANWQDIYVLATEVAKSDRSEKDDVIAKCQAYVKENLIDYKEDSTKIITESAQVWFASVSSEESKSF